MGNGRAQSDDRGLQLGRRIADVVGSDDEHEHEHAHVDGNGRRRSGGGGAGAGAGRVKGVPVLLQPRVPGQSGGRLRLASHHQDPGGRRGHTVDVVRRLVHGAVLLVLSRVEERVHDRQEEDRSGQKRKPANGDQVLTTQQYYARNVSGNNIRSAPLSDPAIPKTIHHAP